MTVVIHGIHAPTNSEIDYVSGHKRDCSRVGDWLNVAHATEAQHFIG